MQWIFILDAAESVAAMSAEKLASRSIILLVQAISTLSYYNKDSVAWKVAKLQSTIKVRY